MTSNTGQVQMLIKVIKEYISLYRSDIKDYCVIGSGVGTGGGEGQGGSFPPLPQYFNVLPMS